MLKKLISRLIKKQKPIPIKVTVLLKDESINYKFFDQHLLEDLVKICDKLNKDK